MTKTNLTDFPSLNFDEIDSLIWDWNGTLLDDVEVNLKVINEMLLRRELKELDMATYKALFCFPVRSFHKKIGFDPDKESTEEISKEYHSTYKLHENRIRLNEETVPVLDSLTRRGVHQYILSAAMQSDLAKMLSDFDIADKFQGIYGVNDICASGKIEIGRQLMVDNVLNPKRTLLVGDTLHDAEVADSLGINYLLYSGGHNSADLLSQKGAVVTSLKEILFF